MNNFKNALISVSNKRGVENLARGLTDMGFRLIATEGTAKAIENSGLNVTTVEDFIGASAVLKDNIRTIHPRIHEGILHTGRLSESKLLKEHHIEPIELVFVNLYPFDSVLAASRQNITQALNEFDVGGPALIRSALKNFNGVTVVSSPEDYETVLWHIAKNNEVPMGLKKQLAIKALNHVVNYDKCALDAFYEPETEID